MNLSPWNLLSCKYHIPYKGHDRTVTLLYDHKNHRTVKAGRDRQTSQPLIPKLRAGWTRGNCRRPCLVGYNNPIAWMISSSLTMALDQRSSREPPEKKWLLQKRWLYLSGPRATECRSIFKDCYSQKMLARLLFSPDSRWETDHNFRPGAVHSFKPFSIKVTFPLTIQDSFILGVSWILPERSYSAGQTDEQRSLLCVYLA